MKTIVKHKKRALDRWKFKDETTIFDMKNLGENSISKMEKNNLAAIGRNFKAYTTNLLNRRFYNE